jgi:hypothetical protein
MSQDYLLSRVEERLSYFNIKIAHVYTETALEPDLGSEVEQLTYLDTQLIEELKKKGIKKLYKFQEEGTELEFVIMVIAVSCVKLLSAHNSTQHTSRKHKV